MAVVLDCESFCWNDPVATDWHLFGVVARPDLYLGNVSVRETVLLHHVVEKNGVLVRTVLTLEQACLTTDQDLKVGHEVSG